MNWRSAFPFAAIDSSFLLQCISLTFVALAWILPFLQPYHRHPIPSFYAEWIASAMGLLAWLYFWPRDNWQRVSVPIIAGVPLALACFILLQAALGFVVYVGQAIVGAMYLVWCSLLIILSAALTEKFGINCLVKVLAITLVVGGEANAVIGVLQHYNIHTLMDPFVAVAVDSVNRASGNVAQANHYVTYNAISLASAGYLFAISTFRNRSSVVLISGPLIFALALSGQRSPWLYVTTLLVFAIIFWIRHRGEPGSRLVYFAVVVFVGFALTQSFGRTFGLAVATDRIIAEPIDQSRIWHARMAFWAFMQSPLFGVGWGHFAWYDFVYQTLLGVNYEGGPSNHAHNIVTHLLAETGLVGILIVVPAAIWWLVNFLKRQFDLEHWWILCLLAVLAIHSMLEYPLWYSYFLGIAAILLGITGKHMVFSLRNVGALGSVIFVVGAVQLGTLLWNYRALERITTYEVTKLTDEAIEETIIRADRDLILRPYGQFLASRGTPISRDFIEERLAVNTDVMHFFPSPPVLYRQAILLVLSGRTEAGERQLADTARVYKTEIGSYIQLLQQHVDRFPELRPLLQLATALHQDTAAR